MLNYIIQSSRCTLWALLLIARRDHFSRRRREGNLFCAILPCPFILNCKIIPSERVFALDRFMNLMLIVSGCILNTNQVIFEQKMVEGLISFDTWIA